MPAELGLTLASSKAP